MILGFFITFFIYSSNMEQFQNKNIIIKRIEEISF